MNNFKTKYLSFDCEYGGVNSKGIFCANFTILEIYAEIWDEKFQVVDVLDLKIKPENGQYIVSAGGLNANKIDIINHDKIAITEGKAKELLYNFLKKHSENGKIKLIPSGQNVTGDIRYLTEHKFISQQNWELFCSFQTLEVATLCFFLKAINLMPQTKKPSTGTISNSLEALGAHFKVPLINLHTAKGDVELFRQICLKLADYLKNYLPSA